MGYSKRIPRKLNRQHKDRSSPSRYVRTRRRSRPRMLVIAGLRCGFIRAGNSGYDQNTDELRQFKTMDDENPTWGAEPHSNSGPA